MEIKRSRSGQSNSKSNGPARAVEQQSPFFFHQGGDTASSSTATATTTTTTATTATTRSMDVNHCQPNADSPDMNASGASINENWSAATGEGEGVGVGVGGGGADPDPPSFSFRTLSAEKRWTLVALAFANFAALACFSLLAPFFPHEAEKKGASQTVTGLIFSTFEVWIFLSSPLYGNFLTRIGSRFLFLSGLFTCGTCSILFGLLDQSPPGTVYVVMCFLVRSVEALGASAFITASFAIIANEFPNHVTTVFGALETFSGLGLMVGPPLGGVLYELGGFGLPFWVMGGLLLLLAVLIHFLLPSRPDQQRVDRGSMLSLLTNPLVCVTLLIIVTGSFSLGFMDPTLAAHLDPYNLSAAVVGLIFIVAPAVYAVLAPLWGYLSDKGYCIPLTLMGNLVAVLCFLMIGPSPLLPFLPHKLWLVIVGLALGGLGIGAALVSTLKCLVMGARQVGFEDNLDTFGLISGLFNSAFSFGTFMGPTVGSVIVQQYSFEWAATVTAMLYVVAGLLFLLYLVSTKSCASGRCCCCCCTTTAALASPYSRRKKGRVSEEEGEEDSPSRPLLSGGSGPSGTHGVVSYSYSSIDSNLTSAPVVVVVSPSASDNNV